MVDGLNPTIAMVKKHISDRFKYFNQFFSVLPMVVTRDLAGVTVKRFVSGCDLVSSGSKWVATRERTVLAGRFN